MDKTAILVAISLSLPIVFVFVTGLVKSLVKAKLTFGNFYLGLDASIAAIANGFVNTADIAQEALRKGSTMTMEDLIGKAGFSLIAIVIGAATLCLTMLAHQRWENVVDESRQAQRLMRGFWLGIVGNGLGALALLSFIYMKLKGYI